MIVNLGKLWLSLTETVAISHGNCGYLSRQTVAICHGKLWLSLTANRGYLSRQTVTVVMTLLGNVATLLGDVSVNIYFT